MFPKIMNDENFYRKAVEQAVAPPDPPDDRQRSGLRFARRIRLPRAVGLGGMFLPVAAVLVTQPVFGGWWLLLVGWSFVWPHLAWQWSAKALDPLRQEIYNLKVDAILSGMWIALMGVNMLPAAALFMMMSMNLMGAGGRRLFTAGMGLLLASCLVTLQLTGLPVAMRSSSLEVTLSLPVIMLYPLLFAWVSYQTAIKLAEHKRRLQAMSSRDGMTGVYKPTPLGNFIT